MVLEKLEFVIRNPEIFHHPKQILNQMKILAISSTVIFDVNGLSESDSYSNFERY